MTACGSVCLRWDRKRPLRARRKNVKNVTTAVHSSPAPHTYRATGCVCVCVCVCVCACVCLSPWRTKVRYDTHLLEASNQGEQSKVTDTPLEGKGRDVEMWGEDGERKERGQGWGGGGGEERGKNGGREGHRPWIPHYYHLLHSEHSICSTAGLHTHTHTQTQQRSHWDVPEIVVALVKVWFSWPEPWSFIEGIREEGETDQDTGERKNGQAHKKEKANKDRK